MNWRGYWQRSTSWRSSEMKDFLIDAAYAALTVAALMAAIIYATS
jgi:hypothetical protein